MRLFRKLALVLMAGITTGAALIAFSPAQPALAANIVGPAGFATLASLPVICGVMSFRLAVSRRWSVTFGAILVALLGSIGGLVAGLGLRIELGLTI